AVQRTVDAVRRVAPGVPIVVRARYLAEREALLKTGASDVVVGELEAAVEILARVLRLMQVPRNLINRELALVRERTQTSARPSTVPRKTLAEHGLIGELKIETFQVPAVGYTLGKSLKELQLRTQTGVSVVAMSRDGPGTGNPSPEMPLLEGDVLYLLGSLEKVRDALYFLEAGAVPVPDAIGEATRMWKKSSPPV